MKTLSETTVIRMPREQVNIYMNMCPVQRLQNKKILWKALSFHS